MHQISQLTNGFRYGFMSKFNTAEDRDYYLAEDPVLSELVSHIMATVGGKKNVVVIDFQDDE